MKRKYPAIDPLKLYSTMDTKNWNEFLYKCYTKKDTNRLFKTLYGLQVGMSDLADQKLNSEKIDLWFIRIQRSIERTLKQIYRDEFNNPLYDPANSHLRDEYLDDKREKDANFESIIKGNRF